MAKDYDREEVNREIARSRPSGHPRCAALRDLGHYEIADGYPDPRGWTVRSADGRDVGEVRDLIVDTGTMQTRYLAVRLDDYFTDERGYYEVLVPIGAARLDDDADNVLVNEMTASRIATLPAYDPNSLTREQEHELRSHFTAEHERRADFTAGEAMSAGTIGPGAIGPGAIGSDFYDHDHFDDRRFFSRGRERAREPQHDDVSLAQPRTEVAEQLALSVEPSAGGERQAAGAPERIIVRKSEAGGE